MTKTRNKLKIMGLVLALVMMVSLLGMFSLTASAVANSVSYGALTDHSLVDGTCTECGEVGYTYDEATNTYTVYTADGLFAVAELVNGGETSINITLAADIVLNENLAVYSSSAIFHR